MADLCVYWIRRTHDELRQCTTNDSLAGRAGLVGTQNIRNNASRRGGLDHVVSDGTIIEAVDNQPWSGEANVNVSIVNWIKTQDPGLVPKKRRLWYEVPLPAATKKRKKGSGPKAKQYQLDMREVDAINSALSDKIDVSQAATLACNTVPQKVFQGLTPGHKGFELKPKQRDVMVAAEPSANTVVHSFIGGDQVLTGVQLPHRYVIDFEQRSITDAAKFPLPFARVQSTVLPDREKMKTQMEALIYHFKIVTEGFRVPEGEVYQVIESPRGELGYYVVSDGTAKPYRVHIHGPSFGNLQSIPTLAKGAMISDVIASMGSMDFVLGDTDR